MGEGEIVIAVLDRGRVRVGRLYRKEGVAFHWRMLDSRIIRRWGTTEGLEQIAEDGPTESTVLDRPCDVTFPTRAVIEFLDVTEAAWEAHLAPKSGRSSKRPGSPTKAR